MEKHQHAIEWHARAFIHDHGTQIFPKEDRAIVRENCGACALEGYCSECERVAKGCQHLREIGGANYAGWERLYVESKRPIPKEWQEAFISALKAQTPYAERLRADVREFGVRWS